MRNRHIGKTSEIIVESSKGTELCYDIWSLSNFTL